MSLSTSLTPVLSFFAALTDWPVHRGGESVIEIGLSVDVGLEDGTSPDFE